MDCAVTKLVLTLDRVIAAVETLAKSRCDRSLAWPVAVNGNFFGDVPFPLVVDNRYFQIRAGDPPLVTIVRDEGGPPIPEVILNVPAAGLNATKSAAGVITVNDEVGAFRYTVRPGAQSSIIFGNVGGNEMEVKITDRRITFDGTVLEANMFRGVVIGIRVNTATGDIAIGCGPTEATLRWAKPVPLN